MTPLAFSIALLAAPVSDVVVDLAHKPAEGTERFHEPAGLEPCSNGGDAMAEWGPGFWGGLGSHERTALASLQASIGPHDTAVERVELGYAHGLWSIADALFRLELGNAKSRASHGRFSIPIPSLGFQYRSPCDGFALEGGARLLLPSAKASPEEFRNALDAAITDGPANDALWLPLADAAVQGYARARLRSRDAHFAVGMEFGGRLAYVNVASWLGPQCGTAGGTWIDLYAMVPKWRGIRLRVRGEMGLSSVWPANEVIPVRAYFGLGISPHYLVSLEAGGGLVLSPQSPTDLKSPQAFFSTNVSFHFGL